MLARRELPPEYSKWNHTWGVPYGRHTTAVGVVNLLPGGARQALLTQKAARKARGPFAFQPNSSTRSYEYPWTYHQLAGRGNSRVLDIGGALSGLQFVLAQDGYEVHNVDPFVDYGTGEYDVDPIAEHAALNELFGTDVVLHRSTLPEASLSGTFDAVYSVSTIEHLSPEDLQATLTAARSLLAPGGLLVLTVDLFLNLTPFCERETNVWGRNASIARIQEILGYEEIVTGDRHQLYGYPEFSPGEVLSSLEDYALNMYYPTLAQCVSFRASG